MAEAPQPTPLPPVTTSTQGSPGLPAAAPSKHYYWVPFFGELGLTPGERQQLPPGVQKRILDLSNFPNRQPLSQSNPNSTANPAFVLDPDPTPNNLAVLEATGMVKVNSGKLDPKEVQNLSSMLLNNGSLREKPPTGPSLVVFLSDKNGVQRPHYLPIERDQGFVPTTRLPPSVAVSGVLFGGGAVVGVGVKSSIKLGTTTGLPPQISGPGYKTTTTELVFKAGATPATGPFGGVTIGSSSSTTLTDPNGTPVKQSTTAFGVTAGLTLFGQYGEIAASTKTVSLEGAHGASLSVGAGPFGVQAGVKVDYEGGAFSANYGRILFPGGNIPFPGAASVNWEITHPDESNRGTVDPASGTYHLHTDKIGQNIEIGATFVPGVGVFPSFSAKDLVVPTTLKLPPEVIQAHTAKTLSEASLKFLPQSRPATGTRPARLGTRDVVNQTVQLAPALLFEKETGLSPFRPDGITPKTQPELEAELWDKYKNENQAAVTAAEKAGQEQISALRIKAFQPLRTLATPVAPVFFPAEAAAHLFPEGERGKQTELLKNFARITGVSPTGPDGSAKPDKELNKAVLDWFGKNNPIIGALEDRARSNNPTIASDARQRLKAMHELALVEITEPKDPTFHSLRAAIQEQQSQQLRNSPQGSQKPWERRAHYNGIGYRQIYDGKFSLDVNRNLTANTTSNGSSLTSQVTFSINTPDTTSPTSSRAQRTGIADAPTQRTFGVSYEQQVALDEKTSPLIARHKRKEDLKPFETDSLQGLYNPLAAAARQGQPMEQAALQSLQAVPLPIETIPPIGNVTSQKLSFTIPGREGFSVETSHKVQLVTRNGIQFIVAQLAITADNAGKSSVATVEQVAPLATDKPVEESIASVNRDVLRASQTFLKQAAQNGLAAISAGQTPPSTLVPGFTLLNEGESPESRVERAVNATAATMAPPQVGPSKR